MYFSNNKTKIFIILFISFIFAFLLPIFYSRVSAQTVYEYSRTPNQEEYYYGQDVTFSFVGDAFPSINGNIRLQKVGGAVIYGTCFNDVYDYATVSDTFSFNEETRINAVWFQSNSSSDCNPATDLTGYDLEGNFIDEIFKWYEEETPTPTPTSTPSDLEYIESSYIITTDLLTKLILYLLLTFLMVAIPLQFINRQ